MQKKKTKKVAKKKKVAAKKKTKKVSAVKTQELRIVVSPQQAPTVDDLIEPLSASGNKLALTPTWIKATQLNQLMGKTPAQYIYTRPGKGGMKFNYVTGNFIIKALNFVFGWNWDFEVVAHGKEGEQVWVQGKLTVKSPKGETITKTQFGRADVKKSNGKNLDFGNDLKAATTDAMKKCASMLGIASDVYATAEFKDETGKDVTPPRVPNKPVDPKDPNAKDGPDGEKVLTCQDCDGIVGQAGADFSKRIYGKQLCKDCSKNHKPLKK